MPQLRGFLYHVHRMGIYDREYYRDERSSSFELRGAWSMTTWLIVINAAVFLLDMFTKNWVMRMLEAQPESLLKPYLWWQLITYGFAHSHKDIFHIFWNMFGLWVFGQPVEGIYGSKEFLRFYLVSVFLGGLFWTARVCLWAASSDPSMWNELDGWTLRGASGAVTAVTLLFCIHYPKQTILLMMVLPVPAWFVGAMIIAGDIFGSFAGREGIAFDVHLVGAVFAIVYYKFGWNLGRWTPSFSLPTGLFKRKPRLRVRSAVDDDRDVDDQLASQADQLLEKINREGIDSLTDRERRILEQHSRRVRDRRH